LKTQEIENSTQALTAIATSRAIETTCLPCKRKHTLVSKFCAMGVRDERPALNSKESALSLKFSLLPNYSEPNFHKSVFQTILVDCTVPISTRQNIKFSSFQFLEIFPLEEWKRHLRKTRLKFKEDSSIDW